MLCRPDHPSFATLEQWFTNNAQKHDLHSTIAATCASLSAGSALTDNPLADLHPTIAGDTIEIDIPPTTSNT